MLSGQRAPDPTGNTIGSGHEEVGKRAPGWSPCEPGRLRRPRWAQRPVCEISAWIPKPSELEPLLAPLCRCNPPCPHAWASQPSLPPRYHHGEMLSS